MLLSCFSRLSVALQVMSANGTPLSRFGSYGKGTGEFRRPKRLAYNAIGTGQLIVVDRDNERLCVFTPNGVFVTATYTRLPKDVCVSSEGCICLIERDLTTRVDMLVPHVHAGAV